MVLSHMSLHLNIISNSRKLASQCNDLRLSLLSGKKLVKRTKEQLDQAVRRITRDMMVVYGKVFVGKRRLATMSGSMLSICETIIDALKLPQIQVS